MLRLAWGTKYETAHDAERDALELIGEPAAPQRWLAIRNVTFTEAGTRTLAEKITETKTLTDVHFDWCNLGACFIPSLSGALRLAPVLRGLEFSNMDLAQSEITDFADMLRHNTTLTKFVLRYHPRYPGANGNEILDAVATSNRTLVELRLSKISIGDGGGRAIADILLHNRTMKTLHVDYANLTEADGLQIAAALGENQTMHDVDFYGNHDMLIPACVHALLRSNRYRTSVVHTYNLYRGTHTHDPDFSSARIDMAAKERCVPNSQLLAFLSAYQPARIRCLRNGRTPAFDFLNADGDLAVAHRIAGMLYPSE